MNRRMRQRESCTSRSDLKKRKIYGKRIRKFREYTCCEIRFAEVLLSIRELCTKRSMVYSGRRGAWQQREYVPFYSYYCPEARGVRDIDDEEIDKSAFAEVLR